jgi:hypothetical protein
MAGRPPSFDLVKASFLLVAGVIGVHCVVVLAGLVFCWLNPDATSRCDNLRSQLTELLAGALAAALAFAGGRMGGDHRDK